METGVPHRRAVRSATRWLAAVGGVAAASYVAYVGNTWYRFGHAAPPSDAEADAVLDQFMPTYEVVERFHLGVAAPAEIVLQAATELDVRRVPAIRALFRARALLLRSLHLGGKADREESQRPRALLAWMETLGWRVLAEIPGREVIVGIATKPWEANAPFRVLPAAEFATFLEPGYVKIAWTLRVDPVDAAQSEFRHEMRAATTDPASRATFRRYWSCLSPGVVVIGWLLRGPLKRAAERQARKAA